VLEVASRVIVQANEAIIGDIDIGHCQEADRGGTGYRGREEEEEEEEEERERFGRGRRRAKPKEKRLRGGEVGEERKKRERERREKEKRREEAGGAVGSKAAVKNRESRLYCYSTSLVLRDLLYNTWINNLLNK
jgi:hypothetical protein